MEKLSCIYLQKDEAGSSILTFGLQGDFKVSADADSRVKSIPIPYGNGPKGYFDYSGNQPGLSYSQQALVSVPAFGTQPRAYFYCNLLALLSGGNPFMISYKDGVGDVRHTESVFGGTSSDIYSFTACSIHHQYSWNLECYYQSSTYIKSDITALTTDFCTCYLPAQAHRYTPLAPSSGLFARYVGTKAYELKDHLGNVRATVSDCKIGGPLQANMVPELLSASNYYAFGMLMPGRGYQPEDYRYGFNGQEKDDEIKGSGNSIDFGARIYDPRLGRWLSPDKFEYMLPNLSPYNAMSNNPIFKVDSDGNIDFTYQVAKRKNEDGSMTKVVNVKVIYKVINLSDREIKQEYFQGVNNESRDYFNYKSNDVEYLKGIKDVEVNIDISFKVEKSLDNVKIGENVLLVVNELNGQKTANDPAGLATMGGNVAAVEAQYIFDPLFTSLVLHEVGHNMSLEHIGEKGNVMMPTLDNGKDLGNMNLSDQQKDNSFGRYYNINFRSDTKGSNVQGDVKSKAKDFKYDNVKK